MNSFYLAFSVVWPLFLMMALGYFLKKIGLFHEQLLNEMNGLCFKVFLPLLLFINVYQSNAFEEFQFRLVVFSVVSVLVSFVMVLMAIPFLEKDNKKRGVLVQGIFRSNFILFGLSIVISLYGNAFVGTTALLIAFIIPIFNVLSVVALEVFRDGDVNHKKIWMGIIKNPLIIASIIAFCFIFAGVRLPQILEVAISDVSKVATPLSFIVLGGSFQFSRIMVNVKPLFIGVTGRLLLMPLVFLMLALLMGFRGESLGALLALFASPTAVSSYVMAQQMDGDDELAGQLVAFTSLGSIFTMFMWISALNLGGYL